MDTKSNIKIGTELNVTVGKTDLLDEIGLLEGIEKFDEKRYQQLNWDNQWNVTMLPNATMVMLSHEMMKKAYAYADDQTEDWNTCKALYTDVEGHTVKCSLDEGHKGSLHMHVGCGDINAIWR